MMQLREYYADEAGLLVEYLNNKNVTRYLSSRIPQPFTSEDAKWWIETGSKQEFVRAIEYEGRLAGTIGAQFGKFENERSAEVGYWLAEPFWGKGIATWALSQLVDMLFSNEGFVRLEAPVFAPNKASMRVLEKCDFSLEGILQMSAFKDDVFYDKHLFARIRN